MNETLLLCTRQVSVNSKFPDQNFKDETFQAGTDGAYNYRSFMFFDIMNLPFNINVVSARLVIYLIEDLYKFTGKKLYIYGLLDDFGHFTTYSFQPRTESRYVKFNMNIRSSGPMQIDVTDIVRKWRNGNLINKGILLRGDERRPSLITLGSAHNMNYNLIPKLKLQYTIPEPPSILGNIEIKTFTWYLSFSGSAVTPDIDVSAIIEGTFFIKNLGPNQVKANIEVSYDGSNWSKDTERVIPPGTTAAMAPQYYGKFYRVRFTSAGSTAVDIKFIYQVYR
ncbi:DNRLRE domain-containing protein [Fonticella tunisiensis]|uniref:F5/8 type C domain-containing protein n=1 Tax=Fonticella tunisiensis TaxID=1096341 RepID=A0A4R7KT28_9CLOT|nr:DNRLRE domain-containing protein [Fonticella tunisiensis]TDT61018.1 hypothetical protein EDD71_10922 [Fonticella tunisiensis]